MKVPDANAVVWFWLSPDERARERNPSCAGLVVDQRGGGIIVIEVISAERHAHLVGQRLSITPSLIWKEIPT